MSPPRYRVFIRDADYQIVDELDAWQSLSLVLRFNGTGTWALEVAANDGEGNPTAAAQLLGQASGIVVRRDNETIFSGSAATELRKTWRTHSLAGVDDNVLLEEPARPTPSQASGPYPNEYDVRTGQASTVIQAYVAVNIGPSAPVGCRHSRLTLAADPHLGSTVTGRANFQSLQALLASLAVTPAAGGLGFRILQSDDDPRFLQFSIWAPEDRTAFAKFGVKLSTASDYEDVYAFPDVNYWVVMGGDGFGTNRTIVEGGDAALIASTGRRITGVYDARGITDTGELNQKLAELLAGAVTSRKTTIVPFEVPSLSFGVDWDFGDVVTIVVDGEERAEVVRDVELELTTDEGVRVTPMIGDAGSGNDELVAQHLKTIRDRLTNVELNWRVPDQSIDRAMLIPVLQPPIGQVMWLAGLATPTGYLPCWGQEVSRTTYGALWNALGATSSPWGQGNGSTTFNVPELRNRSPIGSGFSYVLGQGLGNETAAIGAHSHASQPHTHPLTHSHGLNNHTHAERAHSHPGAHGHDLPTHDHNFDHAHPYNHTHAVQATHNHGALTSGPSSTTARGTTAPTLNVATDFHWHTIANDDSTFTSEDPAPDITDGPEHVDTSQGFTIAGSLPFTRAGNDSDSGTFGAEYVGGLGTPSPASTEGDSNVAGATYTGTPATGGGTTVSIIHPVIALNPVIYAGA